MHDDLITLLAAVFNSRTNSYKCLGRIISFSSCEFLQVSRSYHIVLLLAQGNWFFSAHNWAVFKLNNGVVYILNNMPWEQEWSTRLLEMYQDFLAETVPPRPTDEFIAMMINRSRQLVNESIPQKLKNQLVKYFDIHRAMLAIQIYTSGRPWKEALDTVGIKKGDLTLNRADALVREGMTLLDGAIDSTASKKRKRSLDPLSGVEWERNILFVHHVDRLLCAQHSEKYGGSDTPINLHQYPRTLTRVKELAKLLCEIPEFAEYGFPQVEKSIQAWMCECSHCWASSFLDRVSLFLRCLIKEAIEIIADNPIKTVVCF